MSPIETTYPLLTAWQQGKLREVWQQEREAMKQHDPMLLEWVLDYEAATHVAHNITVEYEKLESMVKRIAIRHEFDDHDSDSWIDFYDALQDGALKSYRGILQQISGNRNLMADEIRYAYSLEGGE